MEAIIKEIEEINSRIQHDQEILKYFEKTDSSTLKERLNDLFVIFGIPSASVDWNDTFHTHETQLEKLEKRLNRLRRDQKKELEEAKWIVHYLLKGPTWFDLLKLEMYHDQKAKTRFSEHLALMEQISSLKKQIECLFGVMFFLIKKAKQGRRLRK